MNMNQFAFSRSKKNQNSGCAELLVMAEQELTAFFSAVRELFGSEQAEISAEEWLQELAGIDHLPTSTREWRSLTINVSSRLAGRINAQEKASTKFQSEVIGVSSMPMRAAG